MPKKWHPKTHASDHYDGGADPIDASLLDKMLKIIPYNGKIADINEDDTDRHTLDLATVLGETRKIIMVQCRGIRVSGTGELIVYPNEGTEGMFITWAGNVLPCIIKDGTQRLQYNQLVANDDWDLWCLGYVVEA